MTLAHDDTGAGPVVLLLHSTVTDRRMWDPQVAALVAAGHRVIRCDLRGYGDSPMPDRPYNDADDVAELIDTVADASDGGRVAVVAASGGGRVALEFAARRPERVTDLVLLATALRGHEPGPELRAFSDREDALLAAGDVAGATELNVERWLGPEADENTRSAVRTMQRHAFEVQLAVADEPEPLTYDHSVSTIAARTLLISGAHDLPDFRDIAEHLAAALPGATHRHLDWAGHLPSLERPDLLNPILLAFLAEGRRLRLRD
jgi:pimeloyl-ACP methyl ester carboxylesterase